jgi:hypothetical protein
MHTTTEQITRELKQIMNDYPAKNEDDRYVFLKSNGDPKGRPRELGMLLYSIGGDALLHKVMNDLVVYIDSQADDKYAHDLRQLEFCWNGIGEWMA